MKLKFLISFIFLPILLTTGCKEEVFYNFSSFGIQFNNACIEDLNFTIEADLGGISNTETDRTSCSFTFPVLTLHGEPTVKTGDKLKFKVSVDTDEELDVSYNVELYDGLKGIDIERGTKKFSKSFTVSAKVP